MRLKRGFFPILVVLSLTGFVAPPASTAANRGLEILPTTMFSSRSPAELVLTSLPPSLVSSLVLDKARMAAIKHLDPRPVILLHRGSDIAVFPQAFAEGSKAVLVDSKEKVSLIALTKEAVDELQEHLKTGDVGSAHQTLFDGSKPSNSNVAAPDASPPDNARLAATAARMLQDIKKLSRLKTEGPRDAFAPMSLYNSIETDARIEAASAEIRRLIVAGKFKDAAAAAERIAPNHYWLEGQRISDYGSFYGKKDVDFIVAAIVDLIQRQPRGL